MGQPVDQQDDFLVYFVTKNSLPTRGSFGNSQRLGQIVKPTTTWKNFWKFDAWLWKHRHSQRQLVHHNIDLQLVKTTTNNRTLLNGATTPTQKRTKPTAGVAKALTNYISAQIIRNFRYSIELSSSNSKKLCFSCLRAGHRQPECRKTTCRTCNLEHHTLLHLQSPRQARSVISTVADNTRYNESENTFNTASPPPEQFTATSLSHQTTWTVFLQTAMIPILVNGDTTLCRALLDSGTQSNLITENLVTRLGLPAKKQQVRIFGLGAKLELQHGGTTDVLITPQRE